VHIEVRDTGIGIAPADRERIFEEFYQVAGSASSKGLGIGLSIVQRFAALLGHRLSLDSEPGRGSCFAIELPHVPAHQAQAAAAPLLHEPLQGRIALLVDDDATVLTGVADKLRSWGLTVFASTAAEGALAELAAAGCVPDLIVADYQLGRDEDGIALIDRIRGRFSQPIPALLLTGYGGDEHRAP